MAGRPSIARLCVGTGLSAGLVAFGLYVTDSGGRARALLPQLRPAPRGDLQALDGSAANHDEALVDGQPTRVSRCWARGQSPREVLGFYAAQASRDAGTLPYMVQEDPDGGGAVVWITKGGLRRAALVSADPRGGASYRLLETGAPTGEPRQLPAGMAAPAGCDVALSVIQPDGSGTALLRGAGSTREVAGRCLDALAARGLHAERELAPGDGVLTIPLRDANGPRGTLVVSPDNGDGAGARASIALRRG